MEISEVLSEAQEGDGEACMTHLIFPNKLWPGIKNISKSLQSMKILKSQRFPMASVIIWLYNIVVVDSIKLAAFKAVLNPALAAWARAFLTI